MTIVSNGRRHSADQSTYPCISAGTMLTTNLEKARTFYERFLGFDCVRYAPGKMLIRDRASMLAMERGDPKYMVIDVAEVGQITHPQHYLNHWGVTVHSQEDVDRIHATAHAKQDEFGLRKVQKITQIHGAYGFYFSDFDNNWWEIEYRAHGRSNEMVFDTGDFDLPAAENPPRNGTSLTSAGPNEHDAVVREGLLTHGTMESRNLANARRVYEDVLGLRCVRHSREAQLVAGQGDVMVVCVGVGAAMHEQDNANRWVLLSEGTDSVSQAHRKAAEQATELGIRDVGPLTERGGVARFLLQDADSNWWESTSLPANHYDTLFNKGDVV